MDPKSENSMVIALLKAGKKVLRSEKALQAIDLLVRSKRIWQDYTLALGLVDRWQQHLIVREWKPMSVDLEFRCFVFGGLFLILLLFL